MTTYLKDSPRFSSAFRLPSSPTANASVAAALPGSLSGVYTRFADLLKALEGETGVRIETALAVWAVESGPWPFVPGKPVLRFEAHKFWETWGSGNAAVFDQTFQFGGHGGVSGAPWTQHRMCMAGLWQGYHGNQETEYAAFTLAQARGGREAACRAASFGGPQILGSNFGLLGYASAVALFEAFAESEHWHILGFFDFCKSSGIVQHLAQLNWHEFAKVYNGPGKAMGYAEHINDAYAQVNRAFAGSADDREVFERAAFNSMFHGLAARYFTAPEILFRGLWNCSPGQAGYGLNDYPARELWQNMVPLLRVLESFRARVGRPITLHSIYRNPSYNAAIGGSSQSEHMKFASRQTRSTCS